jgi:hypothetical protein
VLFAIIYGSGSDKSWAQAFVSDRSMLHAHAATWRLDEVGYEHAPMYTPWDQFSEVEVSSWEDGLQSIEDHDWSLPEQDECDKSLIHDT